MDKFRECTIKEVRNNLSEIVERAAIGREVFLITKFGKPKAMITPVRNLETSLEKRKLALGKTFGMWRGRKDMKDSVKWAKRVREKESFKDGKIFN